MKNIPFEIEQLKAESLCFDAYIKLLDDLIFWNEISKIYVEAKMLNEAIDLVLWVEEIRVTNHWED